MDITVQETTELQSFYWNYTGLTSQCFRLSRSLMYEDSLINIVYLIVGGQFSDFYNIRTAFV